MVLNSRCWLAAYSALPNRCWIQRSLIITRLWLSLFVPLYLRHIFTCETTFFSKTEEARMCCSLEMREAHPWGNQLMGRSTSSLSFITCIFGPTVSRSHIHMNCVTVIQFRGDDWSVVICYKGCRAHRRFSNKLILETPDNITAHGAHTSLYI